MRTSCERLSARIFSMTRARWISTVRGLIAELAGDRLVGPPDHQLLQHLALARRQRSPGAGRSRRRRPPRPRRAAVKRVADARRPAQPGSNGFSMKSRAPSFIAWTAIGTSPCPVMTITGGSGPRRRSACSSSRPSISGMRTSVTRQPGELPSEAAARKTPARAKVSTCEAFRLQQHPQRIQHRLVIVDDDDPGRLSHRRSPLASADRQAHVEDHAAARIVARAQPAAVRIDDRAADRQADARCPPGLVVTNGWNSRSATSGASPGPVSATVISTRSLPGRPRADDDLAPLDRRRAHRRCCGSGW